MENNFVFPIVKFPKATTSESFCIIALVSFIFIPFTYGVITGQPYFCLSLPIGVLGLFLFNHITNYKFTTEKTIQKDNNIAFLDDKLSVSESEIVSEYIWSELKDIELNIIAYKNKFEDEDKKYSGNENYIQFKLNDLDYKYFFYIEKSSEYEQLSNYLKDIILPDLYKMKNLKNESLIISKLDFSALQVFKKEYDINRYTDFIHYN